MSKSNGWIEDHRHKLRFDLTNQHSVAIIKHGIDGVAGVVRLALRKSEPAHLAALALQAAEEQKVNRSSLSLRQARHSMQPRWELQGVPSAPAATGRATTRPPFPFSCFSRLQSG